MRKNILLRTQVWFEKKRMASRFEEIMKKMNDNNQSLLMEYVEANFVTRLVLWDGELRGISDDPGPYSNDG